MFFFSKTDTIIIVVNLTILKTGLEMTASLSNFLASLVAGGVVVGAIATALVIISKSDRLTR
jgi:hypothetical protein